MSLTYARLLGSLLVLACVVSGCGLLGIDRNDCNRDMLVILELDPPSTATFTSEHCSMGIVNPTYSATLTIPAVDLVDFQKSTRIQEWFTTAASAISLKNAAEQMKSLLFGSYSDGVISEEVLIDTANPQQYTIYVVRTYVD